MVKLMSSLPSTKLPATILGDICPPNLQLESTLRHLFLYDFAVDASAPGKIVVQELDANPLMPGVILTEGGELLGMISRRKFLEHLSRPYGLELFLKRPLKSLYRFACSDSLIVTADTSIVEATSRSLARAPELLYEPILVELGSQDYRLLDVHQLLVAQSQIHKLATQLLNHIYLELDEANKELQRQASLDGLTQVANRRRFDEYLRQAWLQMTRCQGPVSLIMADVDYFKLYNDSYGHQAGDDCLRQVARAIAQAVQSITEIGCKETLVARYGGEEFAVILPNTDGFVAVDIAEKIRWQVKALQIPHKASAYPFISLSVGVASTQAGSSNSESFLDSPESLLVTADQALYRAKSQGRDRVIGCLTLTESGQD